MDNYGPITKCQVCRSSNLKSVLFMGYLPPVNAMRPLGSITDQETWFPAELLYCPDCHLVQLGYAVDPNILFPPEYPYTSGTTKILRDNFADLYQEVKNRIGLGPSDLIVDIGSNDGTLLSNFKGGGYRVVGIEPSLTAKLAEQRGIPTLMTFFNQESIDQIIREYGNSKVVTATNVFAHIHNVHNVMKNILRLIGDTGIFISESHYLGDLVTTLQYDTIYHEHLRYYSITSLKNLLESHGLTIFHVKRIPTHGGSIRVYASKQKSNPVDPSVSNLLQEEANTGLTSERWIGEFRNRIVKSKLELYEMLYSLMQKDVKIYGVGAPSRASTLITYAGIDDGILECVLEIQGSKKIDKYMPGTKIPVLEESRLYKDQPQYVLLLSWHIALELCRNLKKRGFQGDFIVPLPKPEIIKNAQISIG